MRPKLISGNSYLIVWLTQLGKSYSVTLIKPTALATKKEEVKLS